MGSSVRVVASWYIHGSPGRPGETDLSVALKCQPWEVKIVGWQRPQVCAGEYGRCSVSFIEMLRLSSSQRLMRWTKRERDSVRRFCSPSCANDRPQRNMTRMVARRQFIGGTYYSDEQISV